MCLVYIFSSTKADISGTLRLPGEIISRLEGIIFSHKHDLFCCKKGEAWLTVYSSHSRKAGRAKVCTEANLPLYMPQAGHGAAPHLAGHPTTVSDLSLRTVDQLVLLQGCFSCPGLGGSLRFLVQDRNTMVSHSSQPQLGNILGEGLQGGQDRRSDPVLWGGCSLPPTSHLCVCGGVLNGVLGWQKGCLRATRETCGLGPQLVELYVECGRWDGSASWRMEGAGLSAAVPARASLCSLFQERYLQRAREDSLVTCATSASRAAGEDPRTCSQALGNLLIPNYSLAGTI